MRGLRPAGHNFDGKGLEYATLVRSLEKFKAGRRGYDPANDRLAAAMAGMAGALLPDEQAIKDVVAHIMTLKK